MVNIFKHHSFTGLSDFKAIELLKKNGYNELPSSKNNTLIMIILDVLKEPMFLLLIICGLLYLFLGSINDAFLLLFFVILIIGTTIYQELKVEKALEALKDLSSPRASVIRNGVQKKIPGREVVKGDLIILEEGDRVPADAIVLQSNNLLVDESLLTGESLSVRKSEGEESIEFKTAGGEDTPFVYSSTLIVGGSGVARVIKTGVQTQIGGIGKELQKTIPEETILQKETKKIIKIFAIAGFLVCLLIIIFYYLSTNNLIDSILSALAVAMSIIPEEFAVVLTLFLALGAWRMSKHNVLTRKLNSIQNIGSATVLCVDKTGTLTLNKMVLKKAFTNGEEYDFSSKTTPKKFEKLLKYAVLASQKIPFDPMEKAIKLGVFEKLSDIKEDDYEIVKEYPLSKHLLALSQVWESENKKGFIVASKGAPEAIIDLCHLDNKSKKDILNQVNKFSNEGYRVIGVASAVIKKELKKNNDLIFPKKQHDFEFEFLGLIALQDPVRKSAPNAIKECYQAGIRVIMITGDYAGTAKHIALQAGLSGIEEILTGEEIEKMTTQELKEKVRTVNIFARIAPEQKLLIVNALKANKEVVVMTGDGVNDAPALKSAHVGIAMGARGTEVAREASAMVLIDDDFASIVKAVRMGRRIFDNIKKAMTYIIAIHIPIAGLALFPVLFNWPLIFFPAHIAFLELIIDPICSIAFEAEVEEKNIMKRKPRKLNEPLFNKKTLLIGLLQGVIVLLIVISLYGFILINGANEEVARTIAFTVLIIANLLIVFSMRSNTQTIIESFSKPNKALYIVSGFAITLLLLVLSVPFLRELFSFSALELIDLIYCFIAGFMAVIIFEGIKVYKKIFLKTNNYA
jgi:P-type Ca2+ transporter type 2C